jgi:hypothetical protein
MSSMNTVNNGAYRWMVFKDGNSWVGVALEFNIVVTGDDPKIVEIDLQEAVLGYLESARKLKGFRTGQINSILNQEADKEYESKWSLATQKESKKGTLSPFNGIYKAGISSLAIA